MGGAKKDQLFLTPLGREMAKENYVTIRPMYAQIIDANINRASEGCRILEEIFRFVKSDKALTDQLAQMRSLLIKQSLILMLFNICFQEIRNQICVRKKSLWSAKYSFFD